MAAVVVAGLITWVYLVLRANKHPYWKHAKPDSRPGDVRGGVFKGGGRSVTPRRDAPPDPDA
jgi:hypothetical protein